MSAIDFMLESPTTYHFVVVSFASSGLLFMKCTNCSFSNFRRFHSVQFEFLCKVLVLCSATDQIRTLAEFIKDPVLHKIFAYQDCHNVHQFVQFPEFGRAADPLILHVRLNADHVALNLKFAIPLAWVKQHQV